MARSTGCAAMIDPERTLRQRTRVGAALAAACLCLSASPSVAAQESEPPQLAWQASWPRIRVEEYVATATLLTAVGVAFFALPQREDVWRGGILFDDALRERVVLGNGSDRRIAGWVGDGFYYGLFAYPVVIDVGIAALAFHRSPDVAWQMLVIDAEAFAVVGLISTFTQRLVGRNRPFVEHCASDPNYDDECDDPANRSQSFISGHTAIAFTGAGLVCVHHAHLPLYGGGAPDLLACPAAVLGATTVAISRVIGDRHHPSDALIAASLGMAAGYLLPELLHYEFETPVAGWRGPRASALVMPAVSPDGGGLMLALAL
jgi:membrane-associated phospholipid phosphatase